MAVPLLVVAGWLAGGLAQADQWHHSVSLPMTLEHDSNLSMSATNPQGVSRTILLPGYNLTATYGVDEYKLGLGLRVERSSDQAISRNREDPNLSFGWQRQTETGGFGLVAKYSQVSTRMSELEQTGLIVRDGTSTSQSLGGNWRTALSERNSLAADAEVKTVAYDGGTLTDFTNTTAGVTYSHAWSERIEPFARLTASRYEPSRATLPSSNNTSVLGGVKWKASENMEWTAQAGISKVSGQTSVTGWQGSFVMRYVAPRYDASFDIGRSISASGVGGFVEADQIKGGLGYALDELTRTGLDASWQRSRGLTPNTMQQFGAWASRELSPFWNARLYYQHKQRQQNGLSDASGNVFGASLVYSHPDF